MSNLPLNIKYEFKGSTDVIRGKLPERCCGCARFTWKKFKKAPWITFRNWFLRDRTDFDYKGAEKIGDLTVRVWVCRRCGHRENVR